MPTRQLTFCNVERVTDGHVQVFVRAIDAVILGGENLLAGHGDIHAHRVDLALGVTAVRPVDDHATGQDAIAKSFELGRFLADARLDGG